MITAIKEIIYYHSEKYPTSIMCKFIGASHSGYYTYVKRSELLPRIIKLAGLIARYQKRCGKTYGYRRVRIWL